MKFRLKRIPISKKEWISFFFTLVATLFGVLMAITLTESGNRKKEIQDTVKLLNTAKIVLENTREYAIGLGNAMDEYKKDTVKFPAELLVEIQETNPIPYPDFVETIIANELVAKNVSAFTHNNLFSELINLRKLSNYSTLDFYNLTLNNMAFLLALEVQWQNGKITKQQFERQYEEKTNYQHVEVDKEVIEMR